MIVIMMGISGAGKSTIGRALAAEHGWDFVEGDDLHPEANVDKMTRGEPLNDADRAPWLERLRQLILDRLASNTDTVISCSALKRVYRQRLRVDPVRVRFVYLHGDEALIRRRLAKRRGHFMPVDLLESQRQTLEPPADAIAADAAWSIAETVRYITRQLDSPQRPPG